MSSGCSLEQATDKKETSFEAYNMPSSNGTHNELTLFCDNDLWNNCGIKIITSLAEPVKGLPQNEPRFNLSRLPHNSISNITKRSKSIPEVMANYFQNDLNWFQWYVNTRPKPFNITSK